MKVTLALMLAILVGSLAANGYLYAQQQQVSTARENLERRRADLQGQAAILNTRTSSLQGEKANLEAQVASLERQTADLQNQTANLESENSKLQSENAAIQAQIDQISQHGAPKIVTRLGATDVRSTPAAGHPWSGVIRFYVSGEVWNVGTGVARDCRLHVTIYQGEVVANDTYIGLGTIDAGSYADVAANIYYTGDALTNWTIIPEYTGQ
ncbi:MAG: hypothetical protein ACE14S_06550 [Candidatus Bathyarchaeia archaeon]